MKVAHVGLFLRLEDVSMGSWEDLEVKIREVLKDSLDFENASMDSVDVSFEECAWLEDDEKGGVLPMPGASQ